MRGFPKGLLFFVSAVAVLASDLAANETLEIYASQLGEEESQAHWERAENFRDLYLGNCFTEVRGAPLVEGIRATSEWAQLAGYEASEGLELYNPRTSPDNLAIIDVSPSKTSCWTQLDTPVPPLSIQPILDDILSIETATMTILDEQVDEGLNARTILFEAIDGLEPVILHLRIEWAPRQNVLIAVVQKSEAD